MSKEEIVFSIIIGLIANVIFTVFIVWGIQRLRYFCKLSRHFHNKNFHTFWKMAPDVIVQELTCKVKANKISFSGVNYKDPLNKFEGEFIINPINLKFGEGFHIHVQQGDSNIINSERFGFDKIIIKDNNTFFVDAPYVKKYISKKTKKPIGIPKYQAFVWRKVK